MTLKTVETFLVIMQDHDFVRACVKECPYEDLVGLRHETWPVHVFLLAPEPAPTWTQYGTQLVHVQTFAPMYEATSHIERAIWLLSRMGPKQRLQELERIKTVIQAEMHATEGGGPRPQ